MKKLLLLILFATFAAIPVFGQKITITGIVRNTNLNSIAAVVVTEKGTTNTTLTDADGRYRIEVQPNAVIEFSILGYKKCEYKTSEFPTGIIDITMIKSKYVKFGAFGGMNMSVNGFFYFKGLQEKVFSDLRKDINNHNIKPYLGYNAGIYMDLVNSQTRSYQFGIWFSSSGIKEELDSYEGLSQFYYLTIPVPFLEKRKFGKRQNSVYCLYGFVCDVFLKGNVKETYDGRERSFDIKRKHFFPIAPGGIIGLGYETKKGLGIRFDYDAWSGIYNSNWFLMHSFNASMTYTIPRKKDN